MKLINLNQSQYRDYSNTHNYRNFGQTIEYSMLENNREKKTMFLGLVDSNNNIEAATLLLITNITSLVKRAEAPDGFLIDYSNFELVKIFTEELKKYLLREKITYLVVNPMFKLTVRNKDNVLIEDNTNIYNNLLSLNYKSLGYIDDFERYDVIIESDDSVHKIYNNFNRNTKRNISNAKNCGIILSKGKNKDLELAYNIFKKKTKKSLSFYENLFNIYNSPDNLAMLFFTKINPNKYLISCKKAFEQEEEENEKIHYRFNRSKNKEKLLNSKINSDSTLEKRKQELNNAIKLNQQTNEEIIVGTSIVIKNNHEIYFLIDGYNEKYRNIHSTHILKWALIKKFYNEGYRIFNLGEINKNYQDKQDKYKGLYDYKIGFGGNVIEYSPNLLYVINKPLYNMHISMNKLKKKSKYKVNTI